MSEANEREDDAVPDEDARQTGVADQLPEENPEGQGAGGGAPRRRDADDTDEPDAPGGKKTSVKGWKERSRRP